jgi:hypothetical protein
LLKDLECPSLKMLFLKETYLFNSLSLSLKKEKSEKKILKHSKIFFPLPLVPLNPNLPLQKFIILKNFMKVTLIVMLKVGKEDQKKKMKVTIILELKKFSVLNNETKKLISKKKNYFIYYHSIS